MATYMVRAMSQSDAEYAIFFEQNVIAVGWSEVNFSSYTDDIEKLITAVDTKYYSDRKTAPQVVGKKLNEVRRFKEMRSGDYIVIPYRGAIRLARLGEGEKYDQSTLGLDLCNQRFADYLKVGQDYLSVPRSSLSEGLQRRLRVRGTTIADLSEFGMEIEQLFQDPNASWLSQFTKVESKRMVAWQDQLLKNIRNGKTNLKAGGRGLEELIKCLLDLEGYKAQILSKRRFKDLGDADIEANRSDRFDDRKLLVQVKHHSGQSDAWGAQQLTAILETEKETFAEHLLVLVTTADASPELVKFCKQQNIRLINGVELVEWIYEHIDRMPLEWRASLGISRTGEILFDT